MKLTDISSKYIYDADITNNIESMSKLNFIMKNEVLLQKSKICLYATLVFSIITSIELITPNDPTYSIVFKTAFCFSIIFAIFQLIKIIYFKNSLKNLSKSDIIKNHFSLLQEKYQSHLYSILLDIRFYKLLSDLQIQELNIKIKENLITTDDMELIYKTLLTAKLKATPLPSTTISLVEHQHELNKEIK